MKPYKHLLLSATLFFACNGFTQPINLDRPVKAGELTCFPDIGNENLYYYISDKPHLALNAQDKPQFSFLKYTEKSKTTDVEKGLDETDGGGIVHAVVELGVTDEQLREAKRELQRLKPGAQLAGPVVFRSGKFGIISSFKNEQGDLVKQLVGLGNAPILDGQKAAVSILLTKKGALILWNSFKTSTPDISFSFEMEVGGYRSPVKATIEANWDQIYDHKAFNVGIAATYLAAEIKGAFDDLRRKGAIKVNQTGNDEKLESMITTAYNKLIDLMFSPLNGTGSLGISELGGIPGGNGTNVLDRASNMLNNAKKEAQEQKNVKPDTIQRPEKKDTKKPDNPAKNDKLPPDSRDGNYSPPENNPPLAAKRHEVKDIPADKTKNDRNPDILKNKDSKQNPTPAGSNQKSTTPSFAIVAMFEMKTIHQQGNFTIDLNKSTADHVTMRFDENIGDLSKYMNDKDIFFEVSLDDPLYTQREIFVSVDGLSAQDFKEYINYVNIRMKKVHQSRETTTQEVLIKNSNFNSGGNQFRMVYGWKGDKNRDTWLDYEYETEWSFFGDQKIIIPIKPSRSQGISVAPPYEKRKVEFIGNTDTLNARNVRLVTVRLFYKLGSKEFQKSVTLNPAEKRVSEIIDFMLPTNQFDFEYEITWRLKNNEIKNSGRLKDNNAIIPVDFLK